MNDPAEGLPSDAVTGAFSYTGRFIARALLARGRAVRTLTNHVRSVPGISEMVEVAPLDFSDPAGLVDALRGVDTLYNTYWVRFNRGQHSFDTAVTNTRALLTAARDAGVHRVVQFSVANCTLDSPLPYYRGKARVERIAAESGIPHAIIRPTLVFGDGDVLLNNIAWLLRHAPVFAVPGSGQYRVQPVAGEDVADIAVDAGSLDGDLLIDAAGPEVLTYLELVQRIATAIGLPRRRIVRVRPGLAVAAARLIGPVVRDVVLTADEARGLMDELLVSHEAPLGRARIGDWLRMSGHHLGRQYASELARHFR